MANTNIPFQFEGKSYVVGTDAYDKDGPIVLPDNRILSVVGWIESFPPQPKALQLSKGLPFGSNPQETADLINGSVAREI